MIDWEWERREVVPDDVLDAASTIPQRSDSVTVDLTSRWVDARFYVQWGTAALQRGGDDGWDSAASYAKRAVCGRMDSILVHNHLGNFLGQNFKKKAQYLAKLNVPGLNLLRDTIIDLRNEIEHAYVLMNQEQARRAVEVAELFLLATQAEHDRPMVTALGWAVSSSSRTCTAPGKEFERHEFRLQRWQDPMLLSDPFAGPPEVLVLCPHDASLATCLLSKFNSDQVMELNARIRQRPESQSWSVQHLDARMMSIIREHLRLGVPYPAVKRL